MSDASAPGVIYRRSVMKPEPPSPDQLCKALAAILACYERLTTQRQGEMELPARIAFAHLGRTKQVLKGIVVLCEHGLFAEVGALCRVITEANCFLTWMLQKNGKPRTSEERQACAEEICDAQSLEMAKTIRMQWPHGYGSAENAAKAKLVETEIVGRRGRKFKQSVGDLASEAGKDAGELYDLFYRINCMDAHPTLDAAGRALAGGDPFHNERNLAITVFVSMLVIQNSSKLIGWDPAEYDTFESEIFGSNGLDLLIKLPK